MEFFRQEYWSGLPLPPSRDLPDSGIKPGSTVLQADSLPSEPPEKIIHFIMPSKIIYFGINLKKLKICPLKTIRH